MAAAELLVTAPFVSILMTYREVRGSCLGYALCWKTSPWWTILTQFLWRMHGVSNRGPVEDATHTAATAFHAGSS